MSTGADKVQVLFSATGAAPILKQPRAQVSPSEPLSALAAYLRRQTGADSLFLYLRSAFAPCQQDSVGSLLAAFGEGEGSARRLVVHYSLQPAWG